MSNGMSSSLTHLGLSVFIIIVVLGICKIRKLPTKTTLPFKLESYKSLFLWVFMFVVWVAITEYFMKIFQINEITKWNYPLFTTILRMIGIVILAPLSEEMLFRGLLFKRISDSRLGIYGAVIIPALIFAGIHIQYSFVPILFIFLDGLFYGLSRHYSKSLLVPVVLHSLGNLYAVFQRFIA